MTELRSLANPIDVQSAVEAIAAGGYIAVQYHSVFIMIFAGESAAARKDILRVKNEDDTSKPLSSISFSDHIFSSVDLALVRQPAARVLLGDIPQLQRTLGTMCHLRLPLKKSAVGAAVPTHMVSLRDGIPYVQNLDPSGNLLFTNLSHEVNARDVRLIAASSLNLQGEDEICDLSEAVRFCEERGVRQLLHDPLYAQHEVKGSFPVIDPGDGIAIRDGHIPMGLVEKLTGLELDKTNIQPAKHAHERHLLDMCDSPLRGPQLREHILAYLYDSPDRAAGSTGRN